MIFFLASQRPRNAARPRGALRSLWSLTQLCCDSRYHTRGRQHAPTVLWDTGPPTGTLSRFDEKCDAGKAFLLLKAGCVQLVVRCLASNTQLRCLPELAKCNCRGEQYGVACWVILREGKSKEPGSRSMGLSML